MIDYKNWKQQACKIADLKLDPVNPRIPPLRQRLPQDELLKELVLHEKVLELASNIARNGYAPMEALIAFQDKSELTVLEGNRRLAALKLLMNPDLAPEGYISKARKLSTEADSLLPKTVNVYIAPTRQAAMPRIAEIHTTASRESWAPIQQSTFYYNLISGGQTIDQISKEYNLAKGIIYEYYRGALVYRLATSLDLPSDVKAKVHDTKVFPLTTVERILDVEEARNKIGVVFDRDHGISITAEKEHFIEIFSTIVIDIANKTKDSRELGSNEEIMEYINSITSHKPTPEHKNRIPAKTLISVPSTTRQNTSKRTTPKVTIPSGALFSSDLRCSSTNKRIGILYKELKRMNTKKEPNLVAIGLRVLIELCVSHYIIKQKRAKDAVARFDKKGVKPDDWFPSLGQQLQFILAESMLPLERLEIKAIKKFVEDKDSAFGLSSLDQFVHNYNYLATEDLIHSIMEIVRPMLIILLQE